MRRKILPLLNIIVAVTLIILLLIVDFTGNLSSNFYYIIFMTCIIGFIFPYLSLFLTGLASLAKKHYKKIVALNILSLLLSSFIIYLSFKLYDSKFLFIIFSYLLIIILNIINVFINTKIISSLNRDENRIIRELKKCNNGVIK